MQNASGQWTIITHKDETKNDFHLGVAYLDISPEINFGKKCLEVLLAAKRKESSPPVDSSWPQPDLESIKSKIAELSIPALSIQFMDIKDLEIESLNSSWVCRSFLSRSIIASRVETEEADILVNDLSNENFSYKLRTEHGIPFIEAENPLFQPRVKLWDFETLSSILQNVDRGFEWWEY